MLDCGKVSGNSFFLFILSGLEIVNDFIEEILYVGIGFSRYFMIELCLFLCHLLCCFAGLAEDLSLEIRFVTYYVDLDIFLAGFSDKIDPFGNTFC